MSCRARLQTATLSVLIQSLLQTSPSENIAEMACMEIAPTAYGAAQPPIFPCYGKEKEAHVLIRLLSPSTDTHGIVVARDVLVVGWVC
ncbi:hypothetical protein BKA62DRAFT_237743 [Auriculariales sp. MPI-PUGE-AT-0066]|nr:hypothetical protein BKA62DRAFT_237743 [Auriculariales sp. MPI-PUGE-AT-0066]